MHIWFYFSLAIKGLWIHSSFLPKTLVSKVAINVEE